MKISSTIVIQPINYVLASILQIVVRKVGYKNFYNFYRITRATHLIFETLTGQGFEHYEYK